MKKGGFAGGFFAIYIPSPHEDDGIDYQQLMANPPYLLPLPDLIGDAAGACRLPWPWPGTCCGWSGRRGASSSWCARSPRSATAWPRASSPGILHMEGAEAIGEDLDALHAFHAMGLRSIGPVWSRPTIFGHGVPFAFPSMPRIRAMA